MNDYGVKAGWFIPFVDKRVWVAGKNCVIPLTRAIPERIRGCVRRCAVEIYIYFALLVTYRILSISFILQHLFSFPVPFSPLPFPSHPSPFLSTSLPCFLSFIRYSLHYDID